MASKKRVKRKRIVRVKKVVSAAPPKKIQERFVINGYVVMLVLILIIALVFFAFNFDNLLREETERISTCGDGSFYNTCSINKPYMCEKGVLAERARFCGCPEGFKKNEDMCTSSLMTNEKEITLGYMLNAEEKDIGLVLYKGIYNYFENVSRVISYNGEEKPFRVDFKFKKINDKNQRENLMPLAVEIQNTASSKDDQARIVISLVQNIPFGQSNKTINLSENKTLSYSRYPYEVLYENAGICGEKSELLAFLLKELGFGVVLFYNQAENHEAVGIACPLEYSYWNSGYCFVETSGPSIISDEEITYAGNVKLSSKPEIMFISSGISLSEGLQEYKDAEELVKIRQKLEQGKKLNGVESKKLDELNTKYGLVEIYNV